MKKMDALGEGEGEERTGDASVLVQNHEVGDAVGFARAHELRQLDASAIHSLRAGHQLTHLFRELAQTRTRRP